MVTLTGVHLIPSTGEFTYDTVPYLGQRVDEVFPSVINTYAGQAPTTDYTVSIDQLLAEHPECTTISVVIAWFFDTLSADTCNIYPSTTYIDGVFYTQAGAEDNWRCSGLNQHTPGLIAIPTQNDSYIYGGTPSDQSIVRCIRDIKSRGLRVIFYPFLLGTGSGEPWRGEITYSPDLSTAATTAIDDFLGSATISDFTPDYIDLTVNYTGTITDWTYRRMILHYAYLMVVAGGVNLFVIGSELRGLEIVRGPGWTKAGTVDGSGYAIWDNPFIAGLKQLAADVRSVFDTAGLTKSLSGLANLITYSADWSSWMGWQYPGENGQWPHLDSLFASNNIDVVSFDNYLPLSDWTTSDESLDILYWSVPAPTTWPPNDDDIIGLGLIGLPTIYSIPYLKANIEGGEKFNWFYYDSNNLGVGLDPTGSNNYISVPEGDRLTQTREPYYPLQELLANKQFRWWWNNPHQAVYDNGDGNGYYPHGPQTEWLPNSKSIIFLEYGYANVDKAPNQPNVFYSPASVQSDTPYWSLWNIDGTGFAPKRDDTVAGLALEAMYEYWNVDGNNSTIGGIELILWPFCCAWNWDARPYPVFPLDTSIWADGADWATGFWLTGPRGYTSQSELTVMTAILDIANRALQAVGTRTSMTLSEFTNQTSNEAIQCNLIMTPVRRQLLRMAPWSCGMKTANLVYITSSPGTPENTTAQTTLWQPGQPQPPWAYEYQYPVDCLRTCWIIPATQTGFSGGIPITTAVTGGASSFWQGPPVKFTVATDTFIPVTGATVVNGGTGHAVGDIITLASTPSGSVPIGAPAQLTVLTISGGVIQTVGVVNSVGNASTSASGNSETIGGSYFAQQTNPVAQGSSTGSGINATFNLTYGSAAPQRVILTNQEFATLTYIQDIADPNVMDDQFQEAYVSILAARLTMALTGDKKLANMKIQEANALIALARTGDGNEGLTVNDITPDWLRTRGIDFAEPYSGPYSGLDWGGFYPVFG